MKWIYLIIVLCSPNDIQGFMKFNSFNCESFVKDVVQVEFCKINAIDRNHNVINMKLHVVRDIINAKMRVQFIKRERGGWHPFMYNFQFDFCDFFKHRQKYIIYNLVHTFLDAYTNINHTCPYKANSVLNLVNLTLDEAGLLKRFPVDYGEYGVRFMYHNENKLALSVNTSLKYTEF